jgi:G3E family GTPase
VTLLEAQDGVIALTIVGGFLGAGKSTWLQHQLQNGDGASHVLVNEAADFPVDQLFAKGAASVQVLAGGCCCCEGLDTLRRSLRSLCDTLDRNGARGARVWLETSGLAEPRRIVDAVQADPMLGRRLRVEEVILVVDPGHLEQQLEESSLVMRQIQSATQFIVSKVDVTSAHVLDRVFSTLQRLNPGVAIAFSDRGIPREVRVTSTTEAFHIPLHDRSAEQPSVVSLSLSASSPWSVVSVWLSALLFSRQQDVFRMKGIINTPAGMLLVQSVRDKMQAPQKLALDATQGVSLVIIGHGLEHQALQSSLDAWQQV